MGFTHIWLMGVVRHATTTSYDLPGLEADDTDLMKGLAGSPTLLRITSMWLRTWRANLRNALRNLAR